MHCSTEAQLRGKTIAFFTYNERLCDGILFSGHRPIGSYASQPFLALRQKLRAYSCHISTIDQVKIRDSIDIIVFLDLPPSPRDVLRIKLLYPSAILVLYILESPPYHPGQFSKINYRPFDAVVSYNEHQCDERFIFFCPIPFDLPESVEEEGSCWFSGWENRKPLCLINSRKKAGFLCDSGVGLLHRLGVRGLGEPWHTPISSFLTQWRGYQYSLRNSLAYALDKCSPENAFDVFGLGWNGEPISYIEKFIRKPKPLGAARGVASESKHSLLSRYKYSIVVENWQGKEGYISEKIFESIVAGSIPIYWGSQPLANFLPAKSFVDGHCFKKPRDIIDFVLTEPKRVWEDRQDALKSFSKSSQFLLRTPSGFADRFIKILSLVHLYQS